MYLFREAGRNIIEGGELMRKEIAEKMAGLRKENEKGESE